MRPAVLNKSALSQGVVNDIESRQKIRKAKEGSRNLVHLITSTDGYGMFMDLSLDRSIKYSELKLMKTL